MDLNKLDLPPFMISELYGHNLVEDQDAQPLEPAVKPKATESTTGYRSLGKNQKHVLVLLTTPNAVHIGDESLVLLNNMLNACQLSMEDVALINLDKQPMDYKPILETFKSRICLLFGIEPSAIGLPMNFPFYQIQAFAGCSFLHAPSLEVMEQDKVERSKLWLSLRRMFNL